MDIHALTFYGFSIQGGLNRKNALRPMFYGPFLPRRMFEYPEKVTDLNEFIM